MVVGDYTVGHPHDLPLYIRFRAFFFSFAGERAPLSDRDLLL